MKLLKKQSKKWQSLKSILGNTSTTLKSQYFVQVVPHEKSHLNLPKTQWAMQPRMIMYIVVVCLSLLQLETADCALVFQELIIICSHLLWTMVLNFSRWKVISTTLIWDFSSFICFLIELRRQTAAPRNIYMSEDLGAFVSVMCNDMNVAEIKQYCISPLPSPLISTLRIHYGAAT